MRPLILLLAAGLLAAAERIVVTGSSTVQPLMAEIAKRYEAAHPGIRIDVQAGGSARGVAEARAGRAQIGMVSRAPKADEGDLTVRTIARDGIAPIVHRGNPVAGLTRADLIGIFTGATTSWAAFGGADRRIIVVNKAEGRATLELFLHHLGLEARQIRAAAVIGDNAQGIKTVAANPDAIGYVSIGAAEADIAGGALIRMVPLDGIAPTSDRVRDGSWPLGRPLTLVVRGEPSPAVAELLAFAGSPAVDDLILDLAFVPPAR